MTIRTGVIMSLDVITGEKKTVKRRMTDDDEYDIVEEYDSNTYPDAKKCRDQRARELKSLGYEYMIETKNGIYRLYAWKD